MAELVETLHCHGVPTWQDVNDLDEVPTEDRIRDVISHPGTSGALLWLSPELIDSEMIRRVEVPELMRRALNDDDFFLVPVLVGGLNYSDLGQLFAGIPFADGLGNWNVYKLTNSGPSSLVPICRRVLARRITMCHRHLAAGEPMNMSFGTRAAPPENGFDLVVDWSTRLLPRPASAETWGDLDSTLVEIASAVRRYAPRREVVASGLSSMPGAISLGAAFPTVAGPDISWDQRTDGRHVRWSLSGDRTAPSFELQARALETGATDLAVSVAVTADVSAAIAASYSVLPPFRAIIEARPLDVSPSSDLVLSSAEGERLARAVIAKMREVRTTYGASGTVHLFIAGPLGLAILIGRMLNTFAEVATYEFMPGDDCPYVPAGTIATTR